MKYSTVKNIRIYKEKTINILLYPIELIGTPIYNYLEESKKLKRYNQKQIRKAVQYLFDYWMDRVDELMIMLSDINNPLDYYNPLEYGNIKTPSQLCYDMGWGYDGENRKIKDKISHIYYYQKEEYLKTIQEFCGEPMTLKEKEDYFKKYELNKIKDRAIYKVNN